MDISIVIVSWNAKGYLYDCIQSLEMQEIAATTEIIIVDNGSSDGSPEMVRREFSNVQLIEAGTNLGFARANNIGIRASSGKYVFLINSDVRLHPGCLKACYEYMQNHPNVGMVGPRVVGSDGLWQKTAVGHPSLWNTFCRALALDTLPVGRKVFGGYLERYPELKTITEVDIIYGCFWVVRRQALGQVGLLDDRFFMYGEDLDWPKRFRDGGWKVVYVPAAEATHYGGASSANAPVRFFIEQERAGLQYWRKHHGRLSYAAYYVICCLHQLIRWAGHGIAAVLPRANRSEHRLKSQRSLECLRWIAGRKRLDEANGSRPRSVNDDSLQRTLS